MTTVAFVGAVGAGGKDQWQTSVRGPGIYVFGRCVALRLIHTEQVWF